MKTVDARGQACPKPVILARKALAEAEEVLVIVDDDTAQMNVSHMAEKAGCHVEAEGKSDGTYLRIVRTQSASPALESHGVTGSTVVLVSSDTVGRGSAELGGILMRGFLHTLNEVRPMPNAIVFMNSGVRLVAEGSEVLEDLSLLSGKGVELLACGTCLDYHKLNDKVAVGQVSNMYSIAETLLQADHVISL